MGGGWGPVITRGPRTFLLSVMCVFELLFQEAWVALAGLRACVSREVVCVFVCVLGWLAVF